MTQDPFAINVSTGMCSNEVLAREGIDTNMSRRPEMPLPIRSSNEVLAREGIDTAQILNASEKCSEM